MRQGRVSRCSSRLHGEDGFEISIPPASTVTGRRNIAVRQSEVQLAVSPHETVCDSKPHVPLRSRSRCHRQPHRAALAWCVGKDRRAAGDFLGAERVGSRSSRKDLLVRRVVLFVDGVLHERGPASLSGRQDRGPRHIRYSQSHSRQEHCDGAGGERQHKKGTKLKVEIRKKLRDVEVAKMPFVENKFFRG